MLALVAEEVKKDSPLGKACAKAGAVLVYEAEKKKLTAWVVEQFKDLGAKAQPDACRLLLDLVGESTDELRLEVEKLALWAAGDEITVEHVEEMVAPRGPVKPWTLTDAWCEHDVTGVLDASDRMLRRGSTPSGLAWALWDHVALVSACRSLRCRGHSPGRGDEAAQAAQRVSGEEGVRGGRAAGVSTSCARPRCASPSSTSP